MFKRYTERARRVIFFARYEASELGDVYIETQHLLLGLIRQDAALLLDYMSEEQAGSIRKEIETEAAIRNPAGKKLSTSVDMPLSNESKRVLAYSAEEAERLRNQHIGAEHLLLGLLRESGSFAAKLLAKRGVELGQIRERLKTKGSAPGSSQDIEELHRSRPMPDCVEFIDVDTGNRIAFAAVHPNHPLPQATDFILLEPAKGVPGIRYQVVEVTFQYLPRSESLPESFHDLKTILIRVRRAAD